MKLSLLTSGRDNNFNLIRIIAALLVLISHAFALSIGTGDAEPLRAGYGMTLGTIAVDIFFITSGFLVTASLLNRKSAVEFVWARMLRVLPALWVMLVVTALIVSPVLSTEPLSNYFTSHELYSYLAKCATLIRGVAFELPGMFEHNPYRLAVNGSLWTLPIEIKMYLILVSIWLFLKPMAENRVMVFQWVVISTVLLAGVYIFVKYFYCLLPNSSCQLPTILEFRANIQFIGLYYMFFTGGTFYILRDYILLKRNIFIAILIVNLLAFGSRHLFFATYMLSLPYLLFYLAYVPKGFIRKYNNLGDYSYGIYIYAFFVEQTVADLLRPVTPLQMIAISIPVTLMLAFFSWHFLESRALKLKNTYVEFSHKMLRRFKSGRIV